METKTDTKNDVNNSNYKRMTKLSTISENPSTKINKYKSASKLKTNKSASKPKTNKKTDLKVDHRTRKNLEKKLTQPNRLLNVLNVVCPASNFCIAFGRENDKINAYFEGFSNFLHLSNKDPNFNLLSNGSNGFVNELIYDKNGYKSTTILKSALNSESDSLFYEGYVGLEYVNKLVPYFPCFLETYGLFYNNSDSLRQKLVSFNPSASKQTMDNIIKLMKKSLQTINFNQNTFKSSLSQSCLRNESFCVLVQYVENPISLFNFLNTKGHDKYSYCVEFPQILFQVYSVLAAIKREFTHYDLHVNNVLLYEVPNGQYIQMIYHNQDNTTTVINTRYIAKIIDYGRCFTKFTKKFYDALCDNRDCTSEGSDQCGNLNFGYNWFLKSIENDNYFISSVLNNPSHDLRLAFVSNKIPHYSGVLSSVLGTKILNKIHYEDNYGTPAIHKIKNKIANVSELRTKLKDYLSKFFVVKMNEDIEKLLGLTKLGVMDIYLDRSKEMTFHIL